MQKWILSVACVCVSTTLVGDALEDKFRFNPQAMTYCESSTIRLPYTAELTSDQSSLLADALDFDRNRPPQICTLDVEWSHGKQTFTERYTPDPLLAAIDDQDPYRNFELLMIDGELVTDKERTKKRKDRFETINMVFPNGSRLLSRIDYGSGRINDQKSTEEIVVFNFRATSGPNATKEEIALWENSSFELAIDTDTRRLAALDVNLDQTPVRLNWFVKISDMIISATYQYIAEIDDAMLSHAVIDTKPSIALIKARVQETIKITNVSCPSEYRVSCEKYVL